MSSGDIDRLITAARYYRGVFEIGLYIIFNNYLILLYVYADHSGAL